jgi:exodeoxyribonuclease V alpha subunit
MLDLVLFYNLLKALPARAHLMLVGDIDQLPSVGAGNVLRDVIDSGVAHVTTLNMIFRQDSRSHIVSNAHSINTGEMPYLSNDSADFFFFRMNTPQEAANMVVDVVMNRVPNKFGFNPMTDIQVLAPMYKGAVGVNALNAALQNQLNGDGRMAEVTFNGRVYRVGDKVMQTKNNYDKGVFNGDSGRIYALDKEDGQLEVLIDDQLIDYTFSELDQLVLSYCISTHRSQGSEYPVIVMPVMPQHFMMLQRNLIYTAITRAKKLVVLVGLERAVAMAVKNNQVAERYSGLRPRLEALGDMLF